MFNSHPFRNRFFGPTRRQSSFQKGDLKYILLDLIKDKSRHGYEIIRELEDQSQGFYKPSPGVIYPTLQMLEEMGYATSAEQEGKKVYSITKEGLEFLTKKKDIANGVKNQIKRKWNFRNIGNMAQVMKEYHNLEQILGQGFKDMDDDKTQRVLEILVSVRQEIEAILEE